MPTWGKPFNAAQFLEHPIQNRNRMIGGNYKLPDIYSDYQKTFKDICPCITATEYKGSTKDKRRASRFYGRRLTLEECAYHQGFIIPKEWYNVPEEWLNEINSKTGRNKTKGQWIYNLYEAIGNGVPVYMAKAFGEMYN